jgi:hypothetical protein
MPIASLQAHGLQPANCLLPTEQGLHP